MLKPVSDNSIFSFTEEEETVALFFTSGWKKKALLNSENIIPILSLLFAIAIFAGDF